MAGDKLKPDPEETGEVIGPDVSQLEGSIDPEETAGPEAPKPKPIDPEKPAGPKAPKPEEPIGAADLAEPKPPIDAADPAEPKPPIGPIESKVVKQWNVLTSSPYYFAKHTVEMAEAGKPAGVGARFILCPAPAELVPPPGVPAVFLVTAYTDNADEKGKKFTHQAIHLNSDGTYSVRGGKQKFENLEDLYTHLDSLIKRQDKMLGDRNALIASTNYFAGYNREMAEHGPPTPKTRFILRPTSEKGEPPPGVGAVFAATVYTNNADETGRRFAHLLIDVNYNGTYSIRNSNKPGETEEFKDINALNEGLKRNARAREQRNDVRISVERESAAPVAATTTMPNTPPSPAVAPSAQAAAIQSPSSAGQAKTPEQPTPSRPVTPTPPGDLASLLAKPPAQAAVESPSPKGQAKTPEKQTPSKSIMKTLLSGFVSIVVAKPMQLLGKLVKFATGNETLLNTSNKVNNFAADLAGEKAPATALIPEPGTGDNKLGHLLKNVDGSLSDQSKSASVSGQGGGTLNTLREGDLKQTGSVPNPISLASTASTPGVKADQENKKSPGPLPP